MSNGLSSFGVLDALDAAYFEVDLKGVITHCNQAFLDKAEIAIDKVVGRHYRHLVLSKQVADLFTAFHDIYQTGSRRRVLFTFIRHKTGGYRTAEGVAGPVKAPSGAIVGFRGILFDVTERIEGEMELLTAKQAAEKELAIGKSIQISFLPPYLPKIDGWELDVHFQSAREVAGDFYDVFPMSNGARLGIVVADVCDKGVGAAMYMATFRTLIRAFANINAPSSLTKAMEDSDKSRERGKTDASGRRVNDSSFFRKRSMLSVGAHPLVNAISMTNQYFVQNHGASNMFATVFFGVLNPFDGTLLYINAGHEPPLLLSHGKVTDRLQPTGPAVGMMDDMTFEIGMIKLQHKDLLVIYTDGVIDARSENGEPFGEERLIAETIHSAARPESAVKNVIGKLHEHIAAQEQFDDVTLMSIYRQ